MFQKVRVFLVACAAITATACSHTTNTHGHVIKEKQIQQIKVGFDTRMDVARTLGSPSAISTFDDKKWYYLTEKTINKPLNPNILTERKLLIIEFDETGKVSSINEKNKDDAREVTPSEKETPTHGQALGVVDQLIENVGSGL